MRALAAPLGATLLALVAACGSASTATPPTSEPTIAPTSSASTAPATTTTTTFQPTAPAASGPAAAADLVAAWAAGDRARAAAVAAPAAVAALLGQPYPRAGLQFRSCGQQAPLTCTYRNLETDGIYDLAVMPAPSGGWYVQSVAVEN